MPPAESAEAPAITAASIIAQVREVVELVETTRPIDDPGPHRPEFVYDRAFYVPYGIYRAIRPESRPLDGSLPLQKDLVGLIADVKGKLGKFGLSARDCKPLIPDIVEGEAALYFALGAFTFLAHAKPAAPGSWLLGVLLAVDPDAAIDEGGN